MKKTKRFISALTIVFMISLIFANTLIVSAAPLPALQPESKLLWVTDAAHKGGRNNGTKIQGDSFAIKFNKDVKGFFAGEGGLHYATVGIEATCSNPALLTTTSYSKYIAPNHFVVGTGDKNGKDILTAGEVWHYHETKLGSRSAVPKLAEEFPTLYDIMATNATETFTLIYSVTVADAETGELLTHTFDPVTYIGVDSADTAAIIVPTATVPVNTTKVDSNPAPVVVADTANVPATIKNGEALDYKALFTATDFAGTTIPLTDANFEFYLSTDAGTNAEPKTSFDSSISGIWYISTKDVTDGTKIAAGQRITVTVGEPEAKKYTLDPHDKVLPVSNIIKDITLCIPQADISHFVNVLLDGVVLAPQHYDVTAGSIVVNLKTSWLNTLAVGSYKITININDGIAADKVDTILEIKARGNVYPITGGGSGGAFPTSGQSDTSSSTTIVGSGSTTVAAVGSSNPSTGATDSLGASVLFATISLLSGAVFVSKKVKK